MNAAEHTGRVLARLSCPQPEPDDPGHRIAASWERSLRDYGLQPDRIARPTVVSASELKGFRAPVEEMIALSQGEIERLYARLAAHDYLVMLADPNGVAVQFRCATPLIDECRRVDVLPGSVWSESVQGTSGIGLCIADPKPVSVVMGDHFAAWLARLSCTVAPIFGAEGRLAAVLNVTTLRPTDHRSQAFVRDIVVSSARRIENLHFERLHADRRIVRVSRYDDFCDMAAEARLALDERGRIVDATPEALRLLGQRIPDPANGRLAEWIDPIRFEAGETMVLSLHGRRGPGDGQIFLRMAGADTGRRWSVAALRGTRPPRRPLPPLAEDGGRRGSVDPDLARQIRLVQRLVDRSLPVLLQGETGTGKSLLARRLHEASAHRGAFVAINCAAIPAELIESELFGYQPGAFTGAASGGARGRLREADGGTLFLDEIGDMPLALQSRLLHVLSEGEFVPLGATRPVSVRFALIAASLHDLSARVQAGQFREDLFYRLAGATLHLPALRTRPDRSQRIEQAFNEAAASFGLPPPQLSTAVRRMLAIYPWPGNLRELQHVARFALTVADGAPIDTDCLPAGFAARPDPPPQAGDQESVLAVLRHTQWNVSAAARLLGLSRATLHRRIRAAGLLRPNSTHRKPPDDDPAQADID